VATSARFRVVFGELDAPAFRPSHRKAGDKENESARNGREIAPWAKAMADTTEMITPAKVLLRSDFRMRQQP
jgi:hypothetical protein